MGGMLPAGNVGWPCTVVKQALGVSAAATACLALLPMLPAGLGCAARRGVSPPHPSLRECSCLTALPLCVPFFNRRMTMCATT